MGEFRRQPSKVWWSTFPDDSVSRIANFPDWGKAVDLSGSINRDVSVNNSLLLRKNEEEEEEEDIRRMVSEEEENPTHDQLENKVEWEETKAGNSWQNEDVNNDRGCSSSPSQGSHKSQDSGFSDSEIHSHPILHTPEDSPELSKRVESSKYEKQEQVSSSDASLTSELKNLHISPNSCVHSPECKNYLETAFDGTADKLNETKSRYQKFNGSETSRSIFTKAQKCRTKNSDKINKIQNQLELSFKFPSKRTNLSPNSKVSKLAISQLPDNNERVTVIQNNTSNYTVIELPKKVGSESDLDSDGFRKPKTLAEQNLNYKGSDNFLNLTYIEGPPISTSTPKSTKFKRQESPTPRAARATEKKIGNMSTFATIRKLKGMSDKKIKRPISLFPSFNRSKIKDISLKNKTTDDCASSIRQWLSELSTMYEAEIMTTLQSKSLATDLTRQVTNMAATTSETIRKLHQKTRIISAEFSRVFEHKNNKKYQRIAPLVQSLVGHVKEFIEDYVQNPEVMPRNVNNSENQRQDNTVEDQKPDLQEMITDFRQEEPKTKEVVVDRSEKKSFGVGEEVVAACEDLKMACDSGEEKLVEEKLTVLGRKFTEVVDMILLTHVKALVHALEEPKTELALRTALSALMSLDLEGSVLSHLVARSEGVRALLAVCLEARATAVRVMALRAMTVVCCMSETIRQFEQAGGLEIVSDILADKKRSEPELSEAVAVLAQITAPWIKDNHSLQSLSQFLGDLVKSLTRIAKDCKSSETLLLSAAALANLTFMEPRTVWPLVEYQTAKILLSAVRRQGPKVSVFIQEQAATVIANMASVPECRKHLAENRAVVALLCFLQIRHSPFQRVPEIAAAERVQQKSAIALSRLCSDGTVAKQVVELQGVVRLVRLCKEERERNNSDGVLVACLAALRKIVANCGTETLEKLEALELVEPRLLDSFLLYSSKQESYV